jgi:hypothetical protein
MGHFCLLPWPRAHVPLARAGGTDPAPTRESPLRFDDHQALNMTSKSKCQSMIMSLFLVDRLACEWLE